MSRILVTGSRGLLGSACKRLFSKTDEVLETGKADLRNRGDVYWLFNHLRPDYVIHCAAKVGGVKANRDNPVEFIEDNIQLNQNIIAACHVFGVKRLVNIATSCIYPDGCKTPISEKMIMTGQFQIDVESYSAAKLLAYMTCRAYNRQHGSLFFTAVPCNLFGPNDNYGPSGHVIPSLIHRAFEAKKNNTPLVVWGNGKAIREFLHSDDAAEAIKLVLEKWDSAELINIGSGRGVSIGTLAEIIADIVGVKDIQFDENQPTGIKEKTFDISKIKSIGWLQKTELENGLFNTCEEYKNSVSSGKLRFK